MIIAQLVNFVSFQNYLITLKVNFVMSKAGSLDMVEASVLECLAKSEQLEEVAGQLTVNKLRLAGEFGNIISHYSSVHSLQ